MLRTVLPWVALAMFALAAKHWFVDRFFPTMPLNIVIWLPIALVFWVVVTLVTVAFLALKERYTRDR